MSCAFATSKAFIITYIILYGRSYAILFYRPLLPNLRLDIGIVLSHNLEPESAIGFKQKLRVVFLL